MRELVLEIYANTYVDLRSEVACIAVIDFRLFQDCCRLF